MAENKEAVEAVAREIAEEDGHDWDILGEYYLRLAHVAIAAARPHILEEAARIAETATPDDDSMDMQAKRQAAAAIRAAKENGDG